MINVDTNELIYCPIGKQNEKMQSSKLKAAREHTSQEKVLASQITSYVQFLEKESLRQKIELGLMDEAAENGFTDI